MKGSVAAGHLLTAEVGGRALAEGGNAVDACVAAAFASWVAESPLTGPGGGGFMLVHSEGRSRLLDFFVAVPERPAEQHVEAVVDFEGGDTQVFHIGEATVAVPGALQGLAEGHRRFGQLPWRELVLPAAELARTGVEINEAQAFLHRILDPMLRGTPEGRAIYPAVEPGDVVRFPVLAETLDQVAVEGASCLPELLPELADDLARYRVIARTPVETRFRGTTVRSNPPPSSGGVLIAYALALLDRLGVGGHGGSPAALARLADVMAETQRVRADGFVAGLYRGGLAKRLLAESTLAAAAARLTGTTHISAVDAEGRAAAMTASTGSGSGVMRAGFQLNNMLGELDLVGGPSIPGRRLTSMMAPTVVLEQGLPRLVVGSAGSARLRGAIVQAIVNVVGHGLPLDEAIARPRIHVEGQRVHVEGGGDADGLAALGYDVVAWGGRNLYFGGVAAVERRADGSLSAAGDPRRGGHGVVVA